MPPVDVWIDTDPAIGLPGCDVDDGLALVQAFHSPELTVRGVSVVFGNAALEKTWPIGRELVARFAPPGIAAHRGAAKAADLGVETEASRALCAALEERPTTILALGPVTNVAAALRARPDLAPRVQCIVAVAARRPGQLFRSGAKQERPFPDLNFECDPDAMQVLLDAGVPLVFTGWEVSSHVWIEPADLDRLAATGDTGAELAAACRSWITMWQTDFGAPGFNPFDTLAIGWATHPELLQSFRADVAIERGVGGAPPQLVARPSAAGHAVYCTEPQPAFKAMLLERLARRAG